MNTTITIDKTRILAEVRKTSCYTGAKSRVEGDFSRVGCTPADDEMLRLCLSESLGTATDRLRRCLSAVNETDSLIQLTLILPEGADPATPELIAADLADYFIAAVTARWFEIAGADDTLKRAAAATACMDSALRKALCKPRPRRPHFPSPNRPLE